MGQRIRTLTVAVTTTGSAGSATGSGVTEAVSGFLLDVHLDFDGDAPGTTDVTVKETGAADNLVLSTDSVTDVRLAPRQSLVTRAAAAITNSHDRIPVTGTITVSVAQCDALDPAVTATIRVLETV